MCGICGTYNFRTGAPADPRMLEKMSDTISHRGPDDSGSHVDGSLGLGFRRLSIIDLEGGHQPMTDDSGRVWVVFNGEIYNFRELRRELQGHGYRFRTTSDTEVIVHGYRQWGIDVVNHLNGMFGLGIWDVDARQLLLARDPFGIKFVYYRLDEAGIRFGSEIRPILASDTVQPRLDVAALNLFLRYRYTPSPYTLYEGIRKLPAGCRLVVRQGGTKLERYYRVSPEPPDPLPSIEEAEEELLARYRRAVKRHLIADVPVGLLLSGGVDSGLLLALMREQGGDHPTFTIGFGDSFEDDELRAAAETARILGADNYQVQLDEDAFADSIPDIVRALEEPVASSSTVPMYHLTRRARQQVKAALVGQGPDELFGGYRRHLGLYLGSAWRSLPGPLHTLAQQLGSHVPRSETLQRGLSALHEPDRLRRYEQVFSLMPGVEVDALFHPHVLPDGMDDRLLDTWADLVPLLDRTDELGGLQFLELRSSLADELLLYGDKLSMAHGLELRVPYLDREVVEYAEQLPASYKIHLGRRKYLHKRVCRSYLPPEIVRRCKLGFQTPVDDWFRAGRRSRLTGGLLGDGDALVYSYLDRTAVRRLADEHQRGTRDHHKVLFSLVILEEWLRHHLPG